MDGFVQIDGDLLLKQAALFERLEKENAELLTVLKDLAVIEIPDSLLTQEEMDDLGERYHGAFPGLPWSETVEAVRARARTAILNAERNRK